MKHVKPEPLPPARTRHLPHLCANESVIMPLMTTPVCG